MAKKRLSIKQTWWWRKDTQNRLIIWAKMLLSRLAAEYRFLLEDKGTGYHDGYNRVIQANCQLFPQEKVNTQFLVTQAILAHEDGHALHTDSDPDQDHTILYDLINILEDEREERCMVIMFPGLAEAFELLARLFWKRSRSLSGADNSQAYELTLQWRFAYRFNTEAEMLKRLGVSRGALAYWDQIKPLVEKSWGVHSVHEVKPIAREILRILGINENRPAPRHPDGMGPSGEGDLPGKRTEKPLPFPAGADPDIHITVMRRTGAKKESKKPKDPGDPGTPTPGTVMVDPESILSEEDLPAEFDSETDTLFFGDTHTNPAPYAALEAETALLATQIGDSMKLPDPEARRMPHAYKGRYSARQELRHPEMPCRRRSGDDDTSHEIAVELLVDRSGSMNRINDPVRRALMALYKGHTRADVRIPTGIKYFGADGLRDKVLTIAPISPETSEEALALIAGFSGETSNEFLFWALEEAHAELNQWNKHHKICIVIHDGDPVYRGDLGNDFELSCAFIKRMNEEGILVIGLYLGDNHSFRPEKLMKLFGERLIQCEPKDLPERLSRMLITIVSGEG